MAETTLLTSTGNRQIDDILREVIGVFEAAFPGRTRAYHLVGSYADGTALPESDIDFGVLFKGRMEEAEAQKAWQLSQSLALISPVYLDFMAAGENELLHADDVTLKLASRLIYGEDIRDAIQLPSLEAYIRHCTSGAVTIASARLRKRDVIVYPLDYPDPSGEFLGYSHEPAADGSFGADIGPLKWLVVVVGRAAQSILALREGQYVATRAACLQTYRERINDQWADFIEDIYVLCRARWRYSVPSTTAERQTLRDLCEHTLAFENRFLDLYRSYLLQELRRGDEEPVWVSPSAFRYQTGLSGEGSRERIERATVTTKDKGGLNMRLVRNFRAIYAAHVLQKIIYPDEETVAALQAAEESDDAELCDAAREARLGAEAARAKSL
ncbi:MAG: nucleotidyltransferase domain-containing protein [Chloroflexota bacterium]|nr:nucleotidyltransferase domain-containing protein [Chloroflexota bacterium]